MKHADGVQTLLIAASPKLEQPRPRSEYTNRPMRCTGRLKDWGWGKRCSH